MIGLRIDVDGYYGLTKGVMNLLSLFEEYDMKATFFINMGKEASIFNILRYRFLKKGLSETDIGVMGRYDFSQKIRMLFLPKFLGSANCQILREISERGHEVQPHAWNHLKWAKNFKNTNVDAELKKMVDSYKKCLGYNPIGFASPQFKYDKRVLDALDRLGFKYASGMKGKKPFHPILDGKKYKHLQIPLTFDKTMEELFGRGMSLREIISVFKSHIEKGKYRCIYFHADYEGLKGLKNFEILIDSLNIKTCTFQDIYRKYN